MPRWQRAGGHYFVTGGAVLLAVATFYALLFGSLHHENDKLMPRLLEMEHQGQS